MAGHLYTMLRRIILCTWAAVAFTLLIPSFSFGATLVPQQLRCEFQTEPLALQTIHPRFNWIVTALKSSARGLRQTSYRIVVSSSAQQIRRHSGDLWDTGKVGSNQTIQIVYGGKPLVSSTTYYWAVQIWDQHGKHSAWSSPARFRMGLLQSEDWKAKWIGSEAATPPLIAPKPKPMPIFRREFSLDKPVAKAIAYVSGLGQYELHINGERIGDAVLTPGWTNYRKTVFYNAYDLTKTLRTGENVIGIMLGNGMYNVQRTPGRYTKLEGSFGPLKLIFQTQIEFTDGTSMLVVSDEKWRCHPGPIVFSSTYGGEDYDARLDQEGWDRPGFKDAGWSKALELDGPGGELVSQENPDIKIEHIYQTQHVTEPRADVQVYDLGQNFSGWPEIQVRGHAGLTVKLIPGELLNGAGLVSQKGSGHPQWFSYTLKGSGIESWHPRFSYYGFRYVQVEPQPGIEVLSVRGDFLYAAVPLTGEFKCSDELFNRIHKLIDAAIQSNMQSVLTDCPHREKLGWLEESHLLGSAVMYNYGVARLYEKISNDMRDAQMPGGLVPDIAPEYTIFKNGFRDSPEWGSAVVIDPWIAYQHYGDIQNLARHYKDMKRYVEYLGTKANGNIISYGLGDWYDVGPAPPGVSQLTSLGVTATGIYYQDIITLYKTALLLNNKIDADHFLQLAAAIRKAFNSRFYNQDTHVYDRGSQTAYAIPLSLGIVPEADRTVVLDKLVQDIRNHQNHVTAGDIGFHYVVAALLQGGRSDVLFDMLSRTDSPSYGYQLARGATTLTEAWDADPRSSQDHFMLGHAEEWFYAGLGGINFELSRPDGERIIIYPRPVGTVTGAQTTYHSVVGTIVSNWTKDRDMFSLHVTIPANASALVYIPGTDSSAVTESGRPIHSSKNIEFVRREDHTLIYRIKSGQYVFMANQ